jgi:acetolactate synthase I/II/III large subunit
MHTASTAFLEALLEVGVSYVFANWGSDHPSLIEAFAQARAEGRPTPEVITCPSEFVALSAAHGFAQTSGRPQAVIVHVECGTQSLAGAVHNAAKGRAPVLIFAGASPFTQDGELPGGRNEFIQWIQDVHDQRGLVRGYMRYDNEIRTGVNIKQLVYRAMQFAMSDPKGPVYLMGAREVMEQPVDPAPNDAAAWAPIAPAALPPDGAQALLADLEGAQRPLVVTSYVGRNPQAVAELVRLCGRLGVGVLDSVPNYVNFPASHPLYLGSQWNHPRQNPALADADVVLVIDSDVPWIPTVSHPRADAIIHHIDVDPLKQQMPLWHVAARRVFRADAALALRQLNESLDGRFLDEARVEARRAHWSAMHRRRAEELKVLEETQNLTGEVLTARLRPYVDDETIVISEGISHYHTIGDHLALDRPGALFTSGGGSLGWNGGAAIGAKLAHPDKTVIALTGDGSYMFSAPSAVHWIAKRYQAPFLQVVYNNRGWKSPKLSALAVHPHGYAARANRLDVEFDPPPDYAGIAAAAGGAFARQVREFDELDEAIAAALRAVKVEKRSAVLDVWLPRL